MIIQYSMKNHSVPAEELHTAPSGGVMNHSNKGFNWEKARNRALAHMLYRAIHLARTNPDYRIQHPNECRDNPECKVLQHCHPEAEKRIHKEHEKILALAVVPSVERA